MIYFPGKTDTKLTTFNYSSTETCTLYMVFELLDKVGPITFRDGKNNVFTFRNIFYKLSGRIVLGVVKYIDRRKLRRKYLLVFQIEKRKLMAILMGNNEKPDFHLLN